MVVDVCRLSKKFGDFTAVDAVDFHIEKGECFGLLGPNGAGKSTVISMLYGGAIRTGGEIRVLGMDPGRESREIKKRTGIVLQQNALDEGMNVFANMMMFARFLGVEGSQREDRVVELLDFMALSHKREAPIRSLSGGMQRRLAFVRALLNDPDFVILDEPTTGLDPAVRKTIWDRVADLLERKKTVLLTTHYMDEAEILCNRIVIMNEGKVQAEGSPRELINSYTPGYMAIIKNSDGNSERLKRLAGPEIELAAENSTIHLRAPHMTDLAQLLEKANITPDLIRPANLEDAFLRITGKELNADA